MIVDNGYVHGGDVYRNRVTLDFSANVNPYGTPDPVKAAIRAAADCQLHRTRPPIQAAADCLPHRTRSPLIQTAMN